MAELWGSVREQLGQVWQRLSRNQKLAVVSIGALSIMVLSISLVWATQPDYAIAYTNLSQEDAAAVVTKLKEIGIPYQIGGGGTTVLVPSSKVYEARLQLASEGLPQGGAVGFEVFDRTSFGVTDFNQKVNYRRALEGELARTISQLAPVQRARVHLVIPEARLYRQNEQPATASVVLMMNRGSRLTTTQIRGITHLVACAVEGLKPENVTVVDTSGNMLSDGFAGGAGAADYKLSANQIEFTQNYERNLATGVEAMLTKVLGPNKVAASVKAELDWQKVETQSETYTPTTGQEPTLSSHEVTEQFDGPGASQGGVPGTQSNVTGFAAGAANGNSSYKRQEKTTNYEIGRTIQHSSSVPGTLKRLSVAVVVDGVENEAQAQNIRNVVTAALGLSSSRGDVITVAHMPFDKSYYEAEQKAMEAAEQQELYRKIAMIGGGIVGVAIVFFFLRRRFRHVASVPRQPSRAPRQRGLAPSPSIPAYREPAYAEAAPEPFTMRRERSKEEMEQEFLREEVAKVARTEPKALANLVEEWLKEE